MKTKTVNVPTPGTAIYRLQTKKNATVCVYLRTLEQFCQFGKDDSRGPQRAL